MAGVASAEVERACTGSGRFRFDLGPVERTRRYRGTVVCSTRDVALNLVLALDGEPVGMVSAMAPDDEGQVELISMWIAPTVRGQGVGDEAVSQVLAWAKEEHPTSSVVLSVKTENDYAIRLYARHGFIDAGPAPDDSSERLMLHQASAR